MYTAARRFTFGLLTLTNGVSLVAMAMGLFGVSEVISSTQPAETGNINKNISIRSMLPTRDDVRRSWLPILRGAGDRLVFGALPGTGATVSAFMSYALEKKVAKNPSRFGKGAERTVEATWKRIGTLIDRFKPDECANYLRNAGYAST